MRMEYEDTDVYIHIYNMCICNKLVRTIQGEHIPFLFCVCFSERCWVRPSLPSPPKKRNILHNGFWSPKSRWMVRWSFRRSFEKWQLLCGCDFQSFFRFTQLFFGFEEGEIWSFFFYEKKLPMTFPPWSPAASLEGGGQWMLSLPRAMIQYGGATMQPSEAGQMRKFRVLNVSASSLLLSLDT